MRRLIPALAASLLVSPSVFAANAVATYEFNNSFAADQVTAPALTEVDPTGTSAFQSDTVLGESRTVWAFNGNSTPTDQQAGLTLNTTGLVNPESYSLDMVFELTQRPNDWRRILDTHNRQSDSGLYIDPSSNLDLFPSAGASAGWTNGVYHHLVVTDNSSTLNFYLDGVSQFTSTTTGMNLDNDPANNPSDLLGVFLDNLSGGGQGEWSEGKISLLRLWDAPLTADEAQTLANNPFASVPEPGSISVVALVAGAMLTRRGGRKVG